MAPSNVTECRKNGVLVVRIESQLPAHRGMFGRQSRADLTPALAAVLAAIDASMDTARLVPILRRAMPGGQEHRRGLTGKINHSHESNRSPSLFRRASSLFPEDRPEKKPREVAAKYFVLLDGDRTTI